MTGKKRCHFWIQGLVEQRAGCLTASHENGIRPIPLVAWETDFSKALPTETASTRLRSCHPDRPGRMWQIHRSEDPADSKSSGVGSVALSCE